MMFHYSSFLHPPQRMPAPRASLAAGLLVSVIGAQCFPAASSKRGAGGDLRKRGLPLFGTYLRPICGPGKRFPLSSVSYHCRPLKSLYRGRQPFQAWRALTAALCGLALLGASSDGVLRPVASPCSPLSCSFQPAQPVPAAFPAAW